MFCMVRQSDLGLCWPNAYRTLGKLWYSGMQTFVRLAVYIIIIAPYVREAVKYAVIHNYSSSSARPATPDVADGVCDVRSSGPCRGRCSYHVFRYDHFSLMTKATKIMGLSRDEMFFKCDMNPLELCLDLSVMLPIFPTTRLGFLRSQTATLRSPAFLYGSCISAWR